MKNRLKDMIKFTSLVREHGISMQRKLMLYWLSVILATFSALLLFLSITGVFPNDSQSFGREISVQTNNIHSEMEEYCNTLTAKSLQMSDSAGRAIESELIKNGAGMDQLNNHPDLLLETEDALYSSVNTALQVSDCSGAFAEINATTNTGASKAHFSRSGLYLRFANVSVGKNLNPYIFYFRGIPDIARERKLQMHNRWNLEFDSSDVPHFQEMMQKKVDRAADACYWTEKIHLKDTWEDVILLCVPVTQNDHTVCGICGTEISSLYFKLAHPVRETRYGPAVTVLVPVQNDSRLDLSTGLAGGVDGTYIDGTEVFTVNPGKYFNIYSSSSGTYVGLHSSLPVKSYDGQQWAVAELVPKESYDAAVSRNNRTWTLLFFGILIFLILLSLFLSHRFVGPIARSLTAIRSEKPLENSRTGITEIDALIAFVQSKAQNQKIERSSMPPDIAGLFDSFAEKAKTLTSAEKGILKYYIDGYEIPDIPDLACISMSTVRKHNRSIYEKLGVSSRDELMLYIDLFRRCDRLNELI